MKLNVKKVGDCSRSAVMDHCDTVIRLRVWKSNLKLTLPLNIRDPGIVVGVNAGPQAKYGVFEVFASCRLVTDDLHRACTLT